MGPGYEDSASQQQQQQQQQRRRRKDAQTRVVKIISGKEYGAEDVLEVVSGPDVRKKKKGPCLLSAWRLLAGRVVVAYRGGWVAGPSMGLLGLAD